MIEVQQFLSHYFLYFWSINNLAVSLHAYTCTLYLHHIHGQFGLTD